MGLNITVKQFEREMLIRRAHNPKLVAKGLADKKLRRLAVQLLMGQRAGVK